MQEKYSLTQEQLNKRKAELEYLLNEELPKNAKDIATARAQGDLSENAEYEIAKEEHAKLMEKKARLENIINNVVIIKKSDKIDEVEIGHKVTFQDKETGEIETILILGQRDGDDSVSAESPLGKALLGSKIGDERTVDAPEKEYYYLVKNIE